MLKLVSVVFTILTIISAWRMFEKAGQSGWVGIIPVLNVVGACKMTGRPYWWALLWLIPIVGLIPHVILSVELARSFGKSALFGLGFAVFPPLFVIPLGLGDARYLGPVR